MTSKKKSKGIVSQYVHSKGNKVYLKIDNSANDWYPINFQWIPVIKLNENMNQ